MYCLHGCCGDVDLSSPKCNVKAVSMSSIPVVFCEGYTFRAFNGLQLVLSPSVWGQALSSGTRHSFASLFVDVSTTFSQVCRGISWMFCRLPCNESLEHSLENRRSSKRVAFFFCTVFVHHHRVFLWHGLYAMPWFLFFFCLGCTPCVRCHPFCLFLLNGIHSRLAHLFHCVVCPLLVVLVCVLFFVVVFVCVLYLLYGRML
jgi:hypothetical protein